MGRKQVPVSADDAVLAEQLRALEAAAARLAAATRHGVLHARTHALESELIEIAESIRLLCASSGVSVPHGLPTLKSSQGAGISAEQILERHVRLLRVRKRLWAAAAREGDVDTALNFARAYQRDREVIHKYCEQAKLPVPPEVSEPGNPRDS